MSETLGIKYEFKKGSAAYVNIKSTYGVNVEASRGLIGKPSMKNVEAFDWKYLHGSTPDLRNRRYENKEITLLCWMTAESKQTLVEALNAFIGFFSYDELMWMKVSWDNNDGHGTITPDPHASKGIYSLVFLKSVSSPEYDYRYGKQLVRFSLTFIDPYPMKQVCKLKSTSGDGIVYDIISDTEIDIYTDEGFSTIGIVNESGTIDCGNGAIILVCGDVVHATTGHTSGKLLDPESQEDSVSIIYNEI